MSQFMQPIQYAQSMQQSYIPVTPQPAGPGFFSRNKLWIGILVVLVIAYVAYRQEVNDWISKQFNPAVPVDTPTGGVTSKDNPAAGTAGTSSTPAPPPAPGTPVTLASTTHTVTNNVKVIEVSKNSPAVAVTGSDANTFQIGEIRAYGATGNLLTAADYSSAVYTASGNAGYALSYPASNAIDGKTYTFTHTHGIEKVHALTLTLKIPQVITKVEILNRHNCCQSRLAGAVVSLKDANNKVIKSQVLTAAQTQVAIL